MARTRSQPWSSKALQTVISLLHSPQTWGVKSLMPTLKTLYYVLLSLSYEDDEGDFGTIAAKNNLKLKSEDTLTLSSILFKEFHKRLSSWSDDVSMDQDHKSALLHNDVWTSVDELLLVLRCCVLLGRLHLYNQIIMDEIRVAVASLHRLCLPGTCTGIERRSIRFNTMISSQGIYNKKSHTISSSDALCKKSSDFPLPFLNRLLEVFLDEVFGDKPFQECIVISETVSSTRGNKSMFSTLYIECVLEVIGAHFLLAISGEQAFQTFTDSLLWEAKQMRSSPELSLRAAISLFAHPVMMSAPKLLLVHLISLVSEVIGISGSPEELRPKVRCVNAYISVLDESVVLYSKLLMKFFGKLPKQDRTIRRSSEAYFHTEIYDRINLKLVDWESSWEAHFDNLLTKTKSSVASSAISYIEMNLNIFDESHRDEVFSFLSSLITGVIAAGVDEFLSHIIEQLTSQDFCLLASLLKLMSSSMLQAIFCLRDCLSCSETWSKKKGVPPGYSSLFAIMSSIGQHNLHLPNQLQQLKVDVLNPFLPTFEEYKLLFIHFAGILSLCVLSGLEFLIHGCLFMMMVLVNALILKEGSLEFLRRSPSSLIMSKSIAATHVTRFHTSTGRKDSVGGVRKQMSSLRIASNFQKTRWLYLRDSDVKTCSGEEYLKHLIEEPEVIAELADFIECKSEKNYTAWFHRLHRFKSWRRQVLAKRLWRKKKVVWNSIRRGTRRKLH